MRCSANAGQPFREIVRQQWNFSSPGAVREIEDYAVDLLDVGVLELIIVPDKSGRETRASLVKMRLAWRRSSIRHPIRVAHSQSSYFKTVLAVLCASGIAGSLKTLGELFREFACVRGMLVVSVLSSWARKRSFCRAPRRQQCGHGPQDCGRPAHAFSVTCQFSWRFRFGEGPWRRPARDLTGIKYIHNYAASSFFTFCAALSPAAPRPCDLTIQWRRSNFVINVRIVSTLFRLLTLMEFSDLLGLLGCPLMIVS